MLFLIQPHTLSWEIPLEIPWKIHHPPKPRFHFFLLQTPPACHSWSSARPAVRGPLQSRGTTGRTTTMDPPGPKMWGWDAPKINDTLGSMSGMRGNRVGLVASAKSIQNFQVHRLLLSIWSTLVQDHWHLFMAQNSSARWAQEKQNMILSPEVWKASLSVKSTNVTGSNQAAARSRWTIHIMHMHIYIYIPISPPLCKHPNSIAATANHVTKSKWCTCPQIGE